MTKFKPTINTIFIHIPKTAGITIYESILDLDKFFGWFLGSEYNEKDDRSLIKANTHGATMLGHIYWKSLIDNAYLDLKYFKRSFKFCFVRNPYDRLVSLYKYHRVKKNLNLEFDEFVKLLYEEFRLKRVPPIGLYNIKTFHLDSRLYHKQIYGNQYNEMIRWIPPDIGFIGRLENFDSDINQLLKILGYLGEPINIPKLNYTRADDYMSYYTNKHTIKYASVIYRHDICRFGYKFI
jgi:hypothetical protein